jgi:hypothetical protein
MYCMNVTRNVCTDKDKINNQSGNSHQTLKYYLCFFGFYYVFHGSLLKMGNKKENVYPLLLSEEFLGDFLFLFYIFTVHICLPLATQ